MAGVIMNKQRRRKLEDVLDRLQGCMTDLEYIKEEEQEAYDNLPESLQYSEKGEQMQENVDDIDYVISDLDSVNNSLEDIINK